MGATLLAHEVLMRCRLPGLLIKLWKIRAGQLSLPSCSMTWVRFANLTSRADLPIWLATRLAPSSHGVSESKVPDRISTGRLAGTSGGLRVIGATSFVGVGQSRQPL